MYFIHHPSAKSSCRTQQFLALSKLESCCTEVYECVYVYHELKVPFSFSDCLSHCILLCRKKLSCVHKQNSTRRRCRYSRNWIPGHPTFREEKGRGLHSSHGPVPLYPCASFFTFLCFILCEHTCIY